MRCERGPSPVLPKGARCVVNLGAFRVAWPINIGWGGLILATGLPTTMSTQMVSTRGYLEQQWAQGMSVGQGLVVAGPS